MARYNSADPWGQYSRVDCKKLDKTIDKFTKFIELKMEDEEENYLIIQEAKRKLKHLVKVRGIVCITV